MDTKQQIAERISKANNILVTVSSNPSVDQLAACIGLTLVCNKLGKHATAVFSGTVPPIISFLEPEKTIEKNTDSLRDFIIALDKSKADKLRYKVEDKVVKIFITPYKTSISEKDLEFSQGDFNVDVILAIGVHNQADLDQAITAHGRILHDATLATLNTKPGGELGGINWLDAGVSSLSEMTVELAEAIDKKMIDDRVATAFLTGIVSETERFSNAKTSPQTMSISAELMALGANQQLVASKLEKPAPAPIAQAAPLAAQAGAPPAASTTKADDGTLEIQHADGVQAFTQNATPEQSEAEKPEEAPPQIHIDDEGELHLPEISEAKPAAESAAAPAPEPAISLPPAPEKSEAVTPGHVSEGSRLILTPPTFESELTANTTAEDEDQPSGNPLGLPAAETPMPLLHREPLEPTRERTIEPPSAPTVEPAPQPVAPASVTTIHPNDETLSQLEQSVSSPHLDVLNDAPGNTPAPVTSFEPQPAPVPATDAVSPASALPPLSTVPTFTPPDADGTLPPASTPASATDNGTLSVPNNDAAGADLSQARAAVSQAMAGSEAANPEPIQALNAQTLGAPLHDTPAAGTQNDATQGTATPVFNGISPLPSASQPATDGALDPNSPPPVPPPMLPPMQ
ncbi:MAG TPA: hypothetical protein VIM53_04085 [Candidatus Saccharimonadales bacterium]